MSNLANANEVMFSGEKLITLIQQIRQPLYVVRDNRSGQLGVVVSEIINNPLFSLLGVLPALYPEWLGDQNFLAAHGARFPYIVGEMANGIATANMVIAAASAGMVGFFGAAGLLPDTVEENIRTIQASLHDNIHCWGVNLIHSPHEPQLEAATVDLCLHQGVTRISASAYLSLSPHLVRYACAGLKADPSGAIYRRNHVLAKISRPEVAKQFMSPAPAEMLEQLVRKGQLTREEATLARYIPVAQDITVEADSGGHTDNRPLTALFPTILDLAETITQQHNYAIPIRVGAAGGLGTPSAIAAAFGLGAAYVLTGSINQAAVESGLSEEGRQLLAQADLADVMMAPAADMFELGVKLQVLKRGTLFGSRATKLYELYSRYDSLEAIPDAEKAKLEKQILGKTFAEVWDVTRQFFTERDPQQVTHAEQSPKHRMALVFRWYLGLSSRWAIAGNNERKMDYQIWCGPAMGAFNRWVANTFLEQLSNRTVEQIARNLLEGAVAISRAQQLRSMGMVLPTAAFHFVPRPLS